MVAEATEAERAELWLQSCAVEQLEAVWPVAAADQNGDASARVSHVSGAAKPVSRSRSFPVEYRGEVLGAVRVTSSPREPLTPTGERLVRDVAAQAGLVLRNVGLIEDCGRRASVLSPRLMRHGAG